MILGIKSKPLQRKFGTVVKYADLSPQASWLKSCLPPLVVVKIVDLKFVDSSWCILNVQVA